VRQNLVPKILKAGSQMKYMRLLLKHGNPLIWVTFLLYWWSGSIEYWTAKQMVVISYQPNEITFSTFLW